jgi:Spy/CpxP family protein refolding chaperone
MEEMLFRDITLTDAQKAQLQKVHDAEVQRMQAHHDAMRAAFDSVRAARQRGDTAAARALFDRTRATMEQERDQHLAAIRNVLTTDQRTQFDKNVADLKAHMDEHLREHEFGPGDRPAFGPRRAAARQLFQGIALTDSQKVKLNQLRESNRRADSTARAQRLAAVRAVLTPEQQAQFDKNVTDLRSRIESRRRERGWSRGES